MDPLLAWGLGLLFLSLILAVGEVFIPSGGTLGLIAAVLAIAALIFLYRYDTAWGIGTTLAMVVVVPMGINLAVKVWPHTPLGRKIIGAPSAEQIERERAAEEAARAARKSLVGKEGVALTDLRPVGRIEIDGVRHEARSETVFIPAGSRIRVSSADMEQIKVRPLA